MNCFFIIYIRCVIRSMLNLTLIELQVQAHSVHLAKLVGRWRALVAAHACRGNTLARVHEILA